MLGTCDAVAAPGQQGSRSFCGRDQDCLREYCPAICGTLLSEQGTPELTTGADRRLVLKHGDRLLTVSEGLARGLKGMVENKDAVIQQLARDVVVPLSLSVQQSKVQAVRCSLPCPAVPRMCTC
jgi:hypothetical protein